MRKMRDRSETKLLGPQAIERKRQNIWPINTEKSWQKKRETHTPHKKKKKNHNPLFLT